MVQATPLLPLTPAGVYWQWRGRALYYVQAGEKSGDRPPLLLVHGFGASTDHWRHNIAELQQDFHVFAIDLLGFGRSAKPSLDYSAHLWQEQLADFIEQVIGQPAVLVGNSLGGYAGLCVAARKPELAAGLVLLNSAGPFSDVAPPQRPPWQDALRQVSRWFFQQPAVSYWLFQYLRQRSVIRRTLKQVYLNHSAITDQLVEDIYRPSCDRGADEVFASVFKTRSGEKVDVLLQQLSCPLLLLWGEGDPWIDARARSAQFRQHYSQLEEHFLKAGHCPHDEIPHQVNALLRSWLLALPASTRL
ncbi:MAG: alpha/beta fold hydrolase [Chloroflexaceae bacterium]|nr:alpha/beta fold hydrolase [Chloroflexaceae bacterium]